MARKASDSRINRATDVGIVNLSGKQVEMQMRQSVSMDLVLHPDRVHNRSNRFGNQHGFDPEFLELWSWQLIRLNDVATRHDTDVAGKRNLLGGRGPGVLELGDHLERRSAPTDDAAVRLQAASPFLGIFPDGPSGGTKVHWPLLARHYFDDRSGRAVSWKPTYDVSCTCHILPGAWHRSATQPGARGIVDGKR
jgi:hypothetical protein